jgi:hypothetical protein
MVVGGGLRVVLELRIMPECQQVLDRAVHNRWPSETLGWGGSMVLDTSQCDRELVTLARRAGSSLSLCSCTCALVPQLSALFYGEYHVSAVCQTKKTNRA